MIMRSSAEVRERRTDYNEVTLVKQQMQRPKAKPLQTTEDMMVRIAHANLEPIVLRNKHSNL